MLKNITRIFPKIGSMARKKNNVLENKSFMEKATIDPTKQVFF